MRKISKKDLWIDLLILFVFAGIAYGISWNVDNPYLRILCSFLSAMVFLQVGRAKFDEIRITQANLLDYEDYCTLRGKDDSDGISRIKAYQKRLWANVLVSSVLSAVGFVLMLFFVCEKVFH